MLFEIATDNVDELFGRTGSRLLASRVGVDQVSSNVILKHDCQQAIHGAAATRDLLQNLAALSLAFQCSRDGINLPFDAANPVEKLLLLANCMTHEFPQYYRGVYIIWKNLGPAMGMPLPGDIAFDSL